MFGVCVSLVDLLKLTSIAEVFREQDLHHSEYMMDVVEVIHALTALYERLGEEQSVLINIPLCVDMCLNWLLNVYDRYYPMVHGSFSLLFLDMFDLILQLLLIVFRPHLLHF